MVKDRLALIRVAPLLALIMIVALAIQHTAVARAPFPLKIVKAWGVPVYSTILTAASSGSVSVYASSSFAVISNGTVMHVGGCIALPVGGASITGVAADDNYVYIELKNGEEKAVAVVDSSCRIAAVHWGGVLASTATGGQPALVNETGLYILDGGTVKRVSRGVKGVSKAYSLPGGCVVAVLGNGSLVALNCCGKPIAKVETMGPGAVVFEDGSICLPGAGQTFEINGGAVTAQIYASASNTTLCVTKGKMLEIYKLPAGKRVGRARLQHQYPVVALDNGCVAGPVLARVKPGAGIVLRRLGGSWSRLLLGGDEHLVAGIQVVSRGNASIAIHGRVVRVPSPAAGMIMIAPGKAILFPSALSKLVTVYLDGEVSYGVLGGPLEVGSWLYYTGVACRAGGCAAGVIAAEEKGGRLVFHPTGSIVLMTYDGSGVVALGDDYLVIVRGAGERRIRHGIRDPAAVIPVAGGYYVVMSAGKKNVFALASPAGSSLVFRASSDPLGLSGPGNIISYWSYNITLINTFQVKHDKKSKAAVTVFNTTVAAPGRVYMNLTLKTRKVVNPPVPQAVRCSNGSIVVWVPTLAGAASEKAYYVIDTVSGKIERRATSLGVYAVEPGSCRISYSDGELVLDRENIVLGTTLSSPFILLPSGSTVRLRASKGLIHVEDNYVLHVIPLLRVGLYGAPADATAMLEFPNGTWSGVGAVLPVRAKGLDSVFGKLFIYGNNLGEVYRIISGDRVYTVKVKPSNWVPAAFSPNGKILLVSTRSLEAISVLTEARPSRSPEPVNPPIPMPVNGDDGRGSSSRGTVATGAATTTAGEGGEGQETPAATSTSTSASARAGSTGGSGAGASGGSRPRSGTVNGNTSETVLVTHASTVLSSITRQGNRHQPILVVALLAAAITAIAIYWSNKRRQTGSVQTQASP